MKKAIITGVLGQSGSYLAELLIEKGYKVIGIYRRSYSANMENVSSIINNSNFELVCGDITDSAFIFSLLNKEKPDELYNMAAQSFVKASFDQPHLTFQVDAVAVLNILEAIRQFSPKTKMMQASTSEMFGMNYSYEWEGQGTDIIVRHSTDREFNPKDGFAPKFQNEQTPFKPQSPYSVAKLAAHEFCELYRRAYGLFICCNISFNHESSRRGKEFVTRKITDYIGRISATPLSTGMYNNTKEAGSLIHIMAQGYERLHLGNIESKRDWGHAKDTVRAAWLALQQDESDTYVISTQETHSVRDFCQKAFDIVGLNYDDFIEIDERFKRPAEVDYLLGDSSYARQKLGWKPEISFEELVRSMVEADIKRYQNA